MYKTNVIIIWLSVSHQLLKSSTKMIAVLWGKMCHFLNKNKMTFFDKLNKNVFTLFKYIEY